jgi:hypothetical protein
MPDATPVMQHQCGEGIGLIPPSFRKHRRLRQGGKVIQTMSRRHPSAIACATLMLFASVAHGQSLQTQAVEKEWANERASITSLRKELDERIGELETLKRKLSAEEANFTRLSRALTPGALDEERGTGSDAVSGQPAAAATAAPLMQQSDSAAAGNGGTQQQGSTAAPDQPVGQAPVADTRPPPVAPIFEQPGVLTPRGKVVLEPSFQFGYSSSDRVALVGYTIIPALLVGLIDVREVKTTTLTGALAARYGLTNRMEFEIRAPYVYSTSDTVSREVFTGTAVNNVFTSNGHNVGDVEATLRYQLNEGGPDKFYFVGWLRAKSNTGKSPFDVVTDCVTRCIGNTTGTGLPLQQPTGSGFWAVQPGLTWLYPSDPVVLFGNFSYLHSFARDGLSLTILNGQKDFIGKVQPGDIWGFSIGMGLALNERASFSVGYDQSIVLPTKENGQTVPGSVRVILGTLLFGFSYRVSPSTTVNLSVGAGLTRDTPDVTFTVRVPMTF